MKPSPWKLTPSLPLIIFLLARIPIILALPYEGLRGYGDLQHFYNLASIPGLPSIHYWIEFPAGFGFLNELIYFLSNGVEHTYTYLFVLFLLAADTGSVILFQKLEKLSYPTELLPGWRSLLYAAVLAGLPYAWWYFDSLAVFFAMLGLYLAINQQKSVLTGVAIGLGILIKLFPALLIPAVIRTFPRRRGMVIAGVALAVFILPNLILYGVSPKFTAASLVSQTARGSAETVWAMLDQNYQTGNFGPLIERLDPATASLSTRNASVVPPLLTLALFGAGGIYFFLKAHLDTSQRIIAFFGLTLVIFFLWSPGWSPQWILYLLPVILLTLEFRPGLLTVAALVLVNLLEWPVLLSRGLFYSLPLTVFLRFLILVLLGLLFYQSTATPKLRAGSPE